MKLAIPTGQKLTLPTGERLRANRRALLDSIQTPAAVAFGLRLLRSQYAGPLIRLRRASDSAELDFSADPITTRLDLDAIAAWAGGDSFCVTWYDQSGNARDATQATAPKQPKFVAVHANGRPGFLYDSTDDELVVASWTQAQPIEAHWAVETSEDSGYIFDSSSGARLAAILGGGGPGGKLTLFAGVLVEGSADRADGATHYGSGQFDGVSSILRYNGAEEATGDVGSDSLNDMAIGNNDQEGVGLGGHLFELIIFGSILAAADRTTIEINQAHYYGLPIFALDKIATAPAACYGLRRLRVAYNGPLVRLRRSSDSQEKDFYALPGNFLGLLNTVEIAAWAGGTAFVVTWYDQSGNGHDVTQATAARQPQYVAAHANGRPGMLFDPTSDTSMSLINDTVTTTQPNETHIVSATPNTATVSAYLLDGGPSGRQEFYILTNTNLRLSAGTIIQVAGPAVDVTTYQSFQCDGASSIIRRNGAEITTADAGTADLDGLRIGNSRFLAHAFDGTVFEVEAFDPALTAADRAVLEADQALHFGVS